ncbi:MAG: hypothetical protein ACXVQQ_02300 [Gaiellaceae bacterium]
MARKIAHLLHRYPVVMAALLALFALFAAWCGHPGMWDGPI